MVTMFSGWGRLIVNQEWARFNSGCDRYTGQCSKGGDGISKILCAKFDSLGPCYGGVHRDGALTCNQAHGSSTLHTSTNAESCSEPTHFGIVRNPVRLWNSALNAVILKASNHPSKLTSPVRFRVTAPCANADREMITFWIWRHGKPWVQGVYPGTERSLRSVKA